MQPGSALFDPLRRAEESIHSALVTLKKTLSTVPIDALGLSWRNLQVSSIKSSKRKPGLKVGKALLQQVHSAVEQLRSQRTSLAQSIAQLPREQTRTDATEDKLTLAKDRADQLVALSFALERVAPELEDMVEELEMASHRGSGAHLEFASKLHFTCPVCFDDEVSVQDAFVVSACGHPICRPCAIRSVDFNIKQLQPQVCPSCMGTPCPVCPITIWQRTHDLEERRSQRRIQRRAELRPDSSSSSSRQQQGRTAELLPEGNSGGDDRAPGSQGEGNEHDMESIEARAQEEGAGRRRRGRRRATAAAHGSGTQGAGDGNQHMQQQVQQDGQQGEQHEPENAGPSPPQVKHCCMTQADMRLLLQPEELQRQQLEMFAQRKRAREQRRQQEQQQQQQQQQQRQRQVREGSRRKRRHAAPGVGSGTAKRRAAAAAAAAPEPMQGKDKQGREQESIMILSDSDDEVLMCYEKDAGAEDTGCMRGGGGSLRGGAAGGEGGAVGSSSSSAAAAAAAAAAAVAAAAAEVAEREKAEEEEEAAELPPTYEAYLKAEALRAVHTGGLFQLCPKCGEGIELIASGPERNRLRCPTCKCDKCLSCGVDWHEGSTCEQYQQWSRENASADEEFKKLISRGEIQACPRCHTATAKVPGYCDHMRCKCGCIYCYKCGREKTGSSAHNHGCPCMNGAAWRHDWRAVLPPGDPRLPPVPGGPRPPPPVQAPARRVHIRGAPAAPAAAAPAPAAAAAAAAAGAGEQPRGGRAHQKAHRRRGAPAQAGAPVQAGAHVQAGAAARQEGAAPRAHQRRGAHAQAGVAARHEGAAQ
ncbi:hypothetical protein DUNSADRAFT_12743 [Dunaliella salina]|uniref:RBR-type E3 ubiquitin transferase n=1 Tax=Dunaliella salina TaxID=3046 RepID=A0ABQ7GAP6_DUNSA|nr:hypothetical protein DUNSADRAFT_12743 [Dunaliella salina]|eukprot:KAF5831689.1 hypothetical protein DUNSADRAFT_12743 [Dunaliella salina]